MQKSFEFPEISNGLSKTVSHQEGVFAKHTQFDPLSGDRRNFTGLPLELQERLCNANGCRISLETNEGEVHYILVNVDEPQAMHCFPLINQILITSNGNSPDTYNALEPGATIDQIPVEDQQLYRYEIELGDLFPRCVLRLSKPLVNGHFDYVVRTYGKSATGSLVENEFPSTMEDHLACQSGRELGLHLDFAKYPRKQLGIKASRQVVNKECSTFALLMASENFGLAVLDGYTHPASLVRNGDRASWGFEMIHIAGGQKTQLRSNDVTGYLTEVQPWHEEIPSFSAGVSSRLPQYPECYLYSWEYHQQRGAQPTYPKRRSGKPSSCNRRHGNIQFGMSSILCISTASAKT